MPLGKVQKDREVAQCEVHLDMKVVCEKPLLNRKTLEKDYPRELFWPWWGQNSPVLLAPDSVPPSWAGSSQRPTYSSIKILGFGYSLPDAAGTMIPK